MEKGLMAFRGFYIKNRYESVEEIITWAQENIGRPMSMNKVHHCVHKHKQQFYNGEKSSKNLNKQSPSSFKMDWHKVCNYPVI